MKKIRIISIITAAVILAEIFSPAALEVKAAGGYYEITDVQGLKKIKDDLSGTYVLKNDIDMGWYSWEPVGDEAHPFTGRFEGNGHVITGIEVEAVAQNGNALAGFFGYTAHAVISNLCLMDASILAFTFNNTENRCFASAGGIAGSINDNTVIDRCCFYGTIEAEGREVNYARSGGIAAGVHSGSVVSDCFACADLTCSSGTANAMAGGICAWVSESTVERCYFDGDITVPDDCYIYAGGINASGNKNGRVAGCVSAAYSVYLQAAGTDHCVYNPVGWFAGEYSDNAYSGNILVSAETVGDSASQRASEEELYDSSFYESLGWNFGSDGWIDTYRYPRLAGVGRRIVIGKDTLSFKNSGTIDYEQYFDVISGETRLEEEQLRDQMGKDGLCFGMCALTEVMLNEDLDVSDVTQSGNIPDIDFENDTAFNLNVKQYVRYLHVMQFDDDYDDFFDDTALDAASVYDAVKAFSDGESDEVPILKVRSEVGKIAHFFFSLGNLLISLAREDQNKFGFLYGHAIIGIDYNEYDDRVEIICYDPNYPNDEKILTLNRTSDGTFESWKYYYTPVIRLSSENPGAILNYYDQTSRIFDDLMEERDVFLTRQEVRDRYGEQ